MGERSLSVGRIRVAFRSAKGRNFRGAKGDYHQRSPIGRGATVDRRQLTITHSSRKTNGPLLAINRVGALRRCRSGRGDLRRPLSTAALTARGQAGCRFGGEADGTFGERASHNRRDDMRAGQGSGDLRNGDGNGAGVNLVKPLRLDGADLRRRASRPSVPVFHRAAIAAG